MKISFKRLIRENRAFLLFVALMLVFRSAIADWNDIPSGSMQPTILVGDRVLINKMAYDIRVPFSTISLKKRSDPKSGDIIVFESRVSDKRLIKRVVGVPGDRVSMSQNVPFVNGRRAQYKDRQSELGATSALEQLSTIQYRIRTERIASPQASFPEVLIPEGFFLVLGDNRDNSADSRVIGLVPRNEIVGRARHVAFSLDYDNYFMPRSERWFSRL